MRILESRTALTLPFTMSIFVNYPVYIFLAFNPHFPPDFLAIGEQVCPFFFLSQINPDCFTNKFTAILILALSCLIYFPHQLIWQSNIESFSLHPVLEINN